MFDFLEAAQNRTAMTAAVQPIEEIRDGIAAGTKVATPTGWKPIEDVKIGDLVLTFDAGMQRVTGQTRRKIEARPGLSDPEYWPIRVPANALGNRAPLTLLPEQIVMIESDCAETVFGDPFAMIPAAALEGFKGIERYAPLAEIEIVSLHFTRDQIVFANVGTLFFCPKSLNALNAPDQASYRVLSFDQADMLVGLMELEEADQGKGPEDLRVFLDVA